MTANIFFVAVNFLSLATDPLVEPSRDELPHCGTACVYGVLKHFDRAAPIAEVERRMMEIDPDADLAKLSLAQLRRLIASFGLHARSVRADLRYPDRIPIPAILFIDANNAGNQAMVGHVVLMRRVTGQGAYVTDLTVFGRTRFLPRDRLVNVSDGRMLLVSDRPFAPMINWLAVSGVLVMLVAAAGLLHAGWRYRRVRTLKVPVGPLLWTCVCGFSGTCGCHHEGNDAAPILIFQDRTIDKGTFRHGVDGEGVGCDFPFDVSASKPVTIVAVETSCGCVSLAKDITGVKLAPGSRHVIPLTLHTKDRAGVYEATGRIVTRPASATPLLVSFRVFVVQLPAPSPAQLVVTSSSGTELTDVGLHVSRVRDQNTPPLHLNVQQSSLGVFSLRDLTVKSECVDMIKGETRDHMTLNLQPTAAFRIGGHSSEIRLAWHGNIPPTVVPVTVRVHHPVSLQVSRFFYGQVKRGEKRLTRLWLRATDGEFPPCIAAESDLEFVLARVDGGNRDLCLDLTAPERLGRFEGAVVLRFSEKGLPPLRLDLAGIVVE